MELSRLLKGMNCDNKRLVPYKHIQPYGTVRDSKALSVDGQELARHFPITVLALCLFRPPRNFFSLRLLSSAFFVRQQLAGEFQLIYFFWRCLPPE